MNEYIEAIDDNRKTWDHVCDLFADAAALPEWGPFGIGEDLDLIGDIKDKTFLDIGCGSGRSIAYLIQNGAKKVYGLDLSRRQLEEARSFNAPWTKDGNIVYLEGKMEDKFDIGRVDCVVSVYAIGWTVSPENTFKNIYERLKPGGKFIWSWDHTFFTDIRYDQGSGNFIVIYSYHDEDPIILENWRKEGARAHITYRKTSSWFRYLRDAGFDITGYYEPKTRTGTTLSRKPARFRAVSSSSAKNLIKSY